MNYIETLKQLGGGISGLQNMVGAKNFVESENSIQFRFKSCKKANICRIYLDLNDTYTVEFYKLSKFECPMVQIYDNVYGDQLTSIFEKFTGLYLSL